MAFLASAEGGTEDEVTRATARVGRLVEVFAAVDAARPLERLAGRAAGRRSKMHVVCGNTAPACPRRPAIVSSEYPRSPATDAKVCRSTWGVTPFNSACLHTRLGTLGTPTKWPLPRSAGKNQFPSPRMHCACSTLIAAWPSGLTCAPRDVLVATLTARRSLRMRTLPSFYRRYFWLVAASTGCWSLPTARNPSSAGSAAIQLIVRARSFVAAHLRVCDTRRKQA